MNHCLRLILMAACVWAAAATASAQDQATFTQQAAQVGDRVAQTVGTELQLNTTITQAGQAANEDQTKLTRRQQRFIEVLEITDGQVRRAHVTFPYSRVTSPDGGDTEKEVVQPIEKKSYLVTRDGEQLQITDPEGVLPPKEEFELVAAGLQNFGLPNPLAEVLLGRTIRVGERLQLPQAIAQQMMGLGQQFGEVKQFELELKSIQQIEDQSCAVFGATIDAVGDAENPVRIRAFGQVVIQTATCRTVRADLSGPLTLSTVEHTPAGSFQYKAQGNMRVALKARYGHARQ